ncbi:hypothetical protein AB3G33_10695 [Flavobacterium sp. WC2421]|uniref:hypothetical protein n=1 Tax=Flavobacterium sp. WC2421 TaxID=3234138 RepID=UPI0034666A19
MKKPKWQINFRDLPEIPKSKLWLPGGKETLEHVISKKLFIGKEITKEENDIMIKLGLFYGILYKSLQELDYTNFTEKDFENFKNYIFYAFNYILLFTNHLTIYKLYRVVINENVSGSKKSLTKKGFLTYPPQHIVAKINKYNRANSPKTTIFYGSETIDTALNEIKPKIGDVISVGVWKPLNLNLEFISYPISHSERGYGINEHSTSALNAFYDLKMNQNETLKKFLEPYLYILGYEFSKPIKHHYEYFLSSLFSEKILKKAENRNERFKMECIIYPSVGNKFLKSNVAVRKDIFRHKFELTKVIEFEVTETNFDYIQNQKDTESINLVKFKNLKETKNIQGNNITW